MINVKIDKGVGSMTFAGSGLEISAELAIIVHILYTQLYNRAGAAIASGCKSVLMDMLAREDSPVWNVIWVRHLPSIWRETRRRLCWRVCGMLRGAAT